MKTDENIVRSKAEDFAVRIVKCCRYIKNDLHEYSLGDQMQRSGTSICANLYEAEFAQSTADFISKLSIALKEASETKFWLKLFKRTDILDDKMYYSMNTDLKEIISLLVAILKSLKGLNDNKKGQ